VVLGEVAAGLPLRCRTTLPRAAPHSDQPDALAVVIEEAEQILTAHRRDAFGRCTGCQEWWAG
jgi:hypothetical protein